MKPMNAIYTMAFAAISLLMLNACSGTSNSSTPAASAYSCTQNGNGVWVDQNGNACNPGTTGATITCPSTGYYTASTGQNVACTPGATVVTSGYGTGYGYGAPTGYGYGSSPSTGCTTYYAIYGQLYVPMYLNGQLVCANYNDLIASMQSNNYYSSYFPSTPYYQGGDQQYQLQYMYEYPPQAYSGYGYGGCDSGSVSFNYAEFGASVCL